MSDAESGNNLHSNEIQHEVEQRWGNTAQFKQVQLKTENYTRSDWEVVARQQQLLYRNLAKVMLNDAAPDSEPAQQITETIRRFISQHFYDCDFATHARLADLYLVDERFQKNFESIAPGLTDFLVDCINKADRNARI